MRAVQHVGRVALRRPTRPPGGSLPLAAAAPVTTVARLMRLSRTTAAMRFVATAIALVGGVLDPASAGTEETRVGIDNPVHEYWSRSPNDRFWQLKKAIDRGEVILSTENSHAFLHDLLARLEVPESSQLLVSSATSLQKGLINPRNPRAIYFNEDTYVGYVPRGRIEIAAIDPEAGPIFYLFDPVRNGSMPHVVRDHACMNCHSPHYLGGIPALVVESVVPGMTGGGEKAFRRNQSGHAVPLEDRFGGWTVTGAPVSWRHWGNIIMEYGAFGRYERRVRPGELFDFARYPVATSDILPHLLHEHQAGFVNRALRAAYAFREWVAADDTARDKEELSPGVLGCVIEELAAPVVEYLLFAGEASLPAGGISGDPDFKAAFLANKRTTARGDSLKDFDLTRHLFRNRCSYMIYSAAFTGLPEAVKHSVYTQLQRALVDDDGAVPPQFAYLERAERRRRRQILNETVPEFAATALPMHVTPASAAGGE
jgi:hypothetical protein